MSLLGKTTASETRREPPGLGLWQFFRLLPALRREPLRIFAELPRRYGAVVRMKGVWTSYLLNHPADIEHVLQTNSQNYRKGRNYEEARASIGNGLLISEGDFWRRQRRLAQPAFHRQRIAAFATVMTDATEGMLDQWRLRAAPREPFDVAAEMMRLTLRIVGLTLFSTDLTRETDIIARSLEVARAHTIRRMWQAVKLPVSFPTPANRRFRRAIRESEGVIYDMIHARRRGEVETDDLLSLLLRARDEETGEAMSDVQLRDEAATILTAGHETTALTLSWTWYLLAQHPHVEQKLHEELTTVLGGRTPDLDHLPRLKYTLLVIQEAMRLYPPVWAISRTALGADRVGGYRIPAGSEILLLPYVTHRHPDLWEQPEAFDPERFLPERSATRPKFAYFPFGGGPRQCIGNNFALMEAQLIVAAVAQQYRLRLVPGHRVEPEPSLTLRPRDGLMMTLERKTE